MKTLLMIVIAVALSATALAQNAAAAGTEITADNVVLWLTPVVVPMLIALVKKVLPQVPSWALPIIAPLLGVALEVINSLATTQAANFWAAAALGLAGIGVREVADQVKKAVPKP
jgi:hypothetical protein